MLMAPIDRFRPRPLPQPMPQPLPTNLVDQVTFQVMDGNGDNAIDQDEWKRAGWDADRFKAFDGNGDGKVSRSEFLAARRFEREFDQKDTDQNGKLDRSEFNGLRQVLLASANGLGEAVGGAAQAIYKCIPGIALLDRFKRFDADGDGTVSKNEYVQGRQKENRLVSPLPQPMPFKPGELRPQPLIKRLPLNNQ